MLVVAAGIFIAVRRFDRAGCTAAAAGTLLFLAFNATLFRSYVAMNDPQWLGHVPMMAGLLCLLQREPGQAPSDRCVVLAAVLMVVGALVKHNLVALPLTATIWLALRHRRALIIWVAVGIVTALLAVIACYAIFGPEMFFDIFQVPREYSAMRMVTKGGVVLLALLPLTIVAARLWRARISDSRIDLFLIGSAIGLLLGIVQRSGFGVDRNAHFEGLTMLCVAAGIFFAAHGFARIGDGMVDERPLLAALRHRDLDPAAGMGGERLLEQFLLLDLV